MDFKQAMAQVQQNKEDQNTGSFGDVVDMAQQGALQTVGGVANFVGADDTARSLDKWANEQYDTLTPEMKDAMAKDIVNDDMSFGEGAKDWRTWLGTASNVLGGMAVTMVPGGAAGKFASLAGAGAKVAQGAGVGTNALLNLAAGNGGQGFNVQKDVENLDFDTLMESPKFKQYVVEESDNGVSDDEALNNARERIAGEIGNAVKTDFTLGAVNLIAETVGDQAFGKLLKGSIGKTIKGAVGKGILGEGGTEAIQGGTEQYRTNVNQNETMGIEGDNMEGVGANALESGLVGAVIGGGAGVPSGAAGRMRRRNFENKIESVVTNEVVGQLRGTGKTDAEIEKLLKEKVESKALGMGFDANESQALAHQAVSAAFGAAPSATERHAAEDQAEAAAQQQQRPEGADRRDQMTDEARQNRQQQDVTWSQQNGYPDPREFGLTQEDAELLIDPPAELTTATGNINPKAPKELKQAYQLAMGRRGSQDYVNAVFSNSQESRQAYDQSFKPQEPQQQPQPDLVEQAQQQPDANNESRNALGAAIERGDLGFVDQRAQQDAQFKQGLQQAFQYSPAAVLQIADARRNGQMNEEQAISALQRVINSVELNAPDQLQPSAQESQLRDQQAQERNTQQQLENRGQRDDGFQPNVEETPEFQRNQSRLLQGMQERAQTKGATGGSQFNGERDVSPLATGIEDQFQSNAPQVEFDRWSDVQDGEQEVDQRDYDSPHATNEQTTEMEQGTVFQPRQQEREQVKYDDPELTPQEVINQSRGKRAGALQGGLGEQRKKGNARQQKKAAKKLNAHLASIHERITKSDPLDSEEYTTGYQPNAAMLKAFQGLDVTQGEPSAKDVSDRLDKLESDGVISAEDKQSIIEQEQPEAPTEPEVQTEPEAPEASSEPKVKAKPVKLGDSIMGDVKRLSTNQVNVYPYDEQSGLRGRPYRIEQINGDKKIVMYDSEGKPSKSWKYGGKDGTLREAREKANEAASTYNENEIKALKVRQQEEESNKTAPRLAFNDKWDAMKESDRRDLLKESFSENTNRLNIATSRLAGKHLSIEEYNRIESLIARSESKTDTQDLKKAVKHELDVELKRMWSETPETDNLALDRLTKIRQRFEKVMNGEATAKDLVWAKKWTDETAKGSTPPEKAEAQEPIAKAKFEKARTGKSDNPRYQAWLDTLDEDELAEITSNVDYMAFITGRRGEFFKSKNMAEREFTPELQTEFDKFIRDYADKNLAKRLKPKKAKAKVTGIKTLPASISRKVKGKLSKIATAQKKVEAADTNYDKVATLNSTERSGTDTSNPRVKAAQQRANTAQKAESAANDELGEVWKEFNAGGGTQEQWDKFMEGQQGHLETNGWDQLQEEYGEAEPEKTVYQSLGDQSEAAKSEKDYDDLYDAVNAALKAGDISEDQATKLDNGRIIGMKAAGLSGLNSNRYNFNVARRYLTDNVGTPNGVDDVRYVASMNAVRDELNKRNVPAKVIASIYDELDSKHVSSRQSALKKIADIVDDKPTPPDGGGTTTKKAETITATSKDKPKKGRTRPSGARNYLKAISSFADGEYSQAEAIDLIDQFIEDKPELEVEFNGYRKNDIGELFARLGQYIDVSMRKDALVKRAVDNIGNQFSAFKSTSGMFVVNSPEKVRAELSAMSESEYNELAAKRVQKRLDEQAESERKKKALGDPKTLDDYQALARANGGTIDAFDDTQLAEFDRLYTENQLERREAQEKRELERKAEVKAVETDGTIELSKIDVLNEAKGEQRYGAAFSEVDSDTFNDMRAKAKQIGGWYARAYKPKNLPARFDFKTESARDDFLSVMGGLNVDQSKRVQEKAQEKTQTKQEKQIEGLREKAAGLQAKADESNNADRQTNTARRASFAAGAAAKADRQEAQANILNKIANGVESGQFKLLGNLNDISQLEELTNIMNRVKWDMPEEAREKYAERDQNGNWHLKAGTKFDDVARFIRFPAPQSTPQSLEYIANEIENVDGFKMTAKSIRSNIKGMGPNERVNLNGARWDKVVDKLRKLARAKDLNVYRAEHINELFKSQDRLTRMGITGDITLRHALREYEQANAGKMTTRKEKTRLQKLTAKIEDIVRGNRNAFNDFFPTPEDEAKQVVELAEIESGMRVLEPNAGMGHIADQIAELNGVDLDVGELAYTLSEMLEEKGHNVVAGDFLEYHAGEIYDRIVMNPPFSNDADIHHINHALSMLKDGGRLVAITSSMAGDRGNTTNKNFRQYLDEVGAEETPLEAGTFNKSLNPTNVATKIIVIDKPADVDYDDIRFSKTSEVDSKPVRGMRTEHVADAAQNWVNDYDGLKGVNVTVVPTMDDLHDLVETEDNALVKGAWLSGDNRVVLVAENLKNAADVRKTLRHELIAHNGLYGNLSNIEQDKLTKQVNSLRGNKALKDIFAAVDKAYKTAPDNVKAEEVIAKIAESEQGVISRMADRLMTWVMGALRRSGIIGQETVTLAEIRTMINNVDKNLRKPNGKTTLSNVVRFSQTISGMDEDTASQGDPAMSVADALAADNDRFYKQMIGKAKNAFTSKIFDSMKNGGWSLLNLRQIAEVGRRRVGQEVGALLDSYVDNKDLFTTRKSELIEKVHKQAEALNKFRRDNPEHAEKTFSLLHDATLADVDPSQEYVDQTSEKKGLLKTLQRLYQEYGGSQSKRGQEISNEMKALTKDIKNEPQLRLKHKALRGQFLKLSPEGQKAFNDVRDHYISQREEMDQALENRIADLAMAGSMKAGENTYHRYMMEKSRLGFYVPLSRFGTYWLDVMDTNGERRFQMYETESEMKADADKLTKAGFNFQNDREADLGTGQMRMGAKLNESRGLSGASASFVSDVVKAVSGTNANDKAKAQLTDEIYQMYLQTMPDRSIRRAFIHRKGVAGYTEDAARVLADQGVKQANQQAKLETEKQFSDLIDLLKTATDKSNNVSAGRLYNEMLQRHDWMLNPQRAAWAQKLTGFGFLWQIGISPASAMLNLGQNWQVALPIIGAKYGFSGTAAEMGKLSGLWAKTFTAKKKAVGLRGEIDTTNGILGDVLEPEEREALRHAIKIGAIDVTQMADLTGMAEQDSKNYSGKMAKLNQLIGAPFHWAEVMNREVAFLTAYRMAKAGGATKQESLDYATKATWDSHFDYSSRNRARFMQGDVAAVALQFRQYSQNMTYYLFRNFFDALKGADAETKRQARRQLAGTFGVTFAIGGLNALPVATLAAVANVAYALAGDDNEPWDAETEFKGALADAFGEDIGKHIYYGTMPSVSSRINIDLLRMWVQESDSQDATSWLENMSQQAMGASFGTAMSFARGANYFAEGKYLRAAESTTPKWIKDVLRTARYASEGGNVTNRNGEILMGDVDPLEYAGQLLGFTPSRLAMTYDRNSALKGYEKEATHRRTSLMNAYWLATRTQDKDGQRSVLRKIQLYNQSDWGRARPITAKVIQSSIKQRRRMMGKSVDGAHYNNKYIKLLQERQYW